MCVKRNPRAFTALADSERRVTEWNKISLAAECRIFNVLRTLICGCNSMCFFSEPVAHSLNQRFEAQTDCGQTLSAPRQRARCFGMTRVDFGRVSFMV